MHQGQHPVPHPVFILRDEILAPLAHDGSHYLMPTGTMTKRARIIRGDEPIPFRQPPGSRNNAEAIHAASLESVSRSVSEMDWNRKSLRSRRRRGTVRPRPP